MITNNLQLAHSLNSKMETPTNSASFSFQNFRRSHAVVTFAVFLRLLQELLKDYVSEDLKEFENIANLDVDEIAKKLISDDKVDHLMHRALSKKDFYEFGNELEKV